MFEQGDRPFYVPDKDELLKYEDDFYYEKIKHITNLENFLRDDLGLSNYKGIVEDFAGSLVIDDDEPDWVISQLKIRGYPKFREFSSKEQARKFYMLYTNLRNHTRKHTHRGHTPFELDDCYEIDAIIEDGVLSKVETPSKNFTDEDIDEYGYIDGYSYQLDYEWYNPTPGNFPVEFMYMGKTVEYNVVLKETTVDSISVTKKPNNIYFLMIFLLISSAWS